MNTQDYCEIQRVIALYSHVADDADGDRLADVFTEDATLSPTQVEPRRGLAEIRDYFTRIVPSQPIPTISHHTMNTVIDFEGDGTRARARSKMIGVRRDMGFICGEYRDLLVRTAAGWRIQERTIIRRTRFSTDPVG